MKNIFEELSNVQGSWAKTQVGMVNGAPVTVRVMNDMEADFHIHENTDEFFLVVSGSVYIDTSTETVLLNKGQSYTVKAGINHRARTVGRAELIVIGGHNA